MEKIERLIIDKVIADYPDECQVSSLHGGKYRGIVLVTKAGFHHGHALYVMVEDATGALHVGFHPMNAELTEEQVIEQVRSLADQDIHGRHFNLIFQRAPTVGIIEKGKFLVGLLRKGESILCQTDVGQFFIREIGRIIVLHKKTPGS
ncbi:MAG: hypothetical protein WCT27_05180 [Patescibacteria group bacterium]